MSQAEFTVTHASETKTPKVPLDTVMRASQIFKFGHHRLVCCLQFQALGNRLNEVRLGQRRILYDIIMRFGQNIC